MKLYCVKCHRERDIKNPKEIKTKNNRYTIQGVCPVCGTKMFRFIKK